MSWFGSSKSDDAATTNFWPVTAYQTGFGELASDDTAWANTSNAGFQTETQVWYTVLADGSMVMVQIIWSYLGVFLIPATTQMTFKYYNPTTKKTSWKSMNASSPQFNKQNCKADQFEIKHSGDPTSEEVYKISATLDKSVQITVDFTKPAEAPGFKLGAGREGGYSIFGSATKKDGHVIHRFHPLVTSSGALVVNGEVVDMKGEGMFVHAIQGMRPNLVASFWNFCFFTTAPGEEDEKLGNVRAVQMEFGTTDDYGPKGSKSGRTKVNIGAIYSSKTSPVPLIITGETHLPPSVKSPWPVPAQDVSSATHFNPIKDSDTGYSVPAGIEFKWEGDRRDGKGRAAGKITLEKQGKVLGEGGLIEKVDVLGEIPYVIRKGLAAVTGTKPYIYQYHNAATLEVTFGDEVIPVKGWVFNEASFVSE